jgi:hypothetical protein
MYRLLIAQLCLASAVSTGRPVEKVVELIKELKTKVETDGANEEKLYNKFACWCETTTKRKADAIDNGKQTIATTTTTILTLKGAISVFEGEIAEHEAAIAKDDEAMKKLTSIREKENGAYQDEKDYMDTTLSSLHSAIEILGGAGTGGDMGLLESAAKVRSAILQSPHMTALSYDSTKLLKTFLENPTSFVQQEPADYYDKKAQAKASYSPQSATVTGILKDMYTTFAADSEKANQEESDLQKAFEDEMKVKAESNTLLKKMIVAKEGQKAEKSQLLDENEMLLEAAQQQLKLDEGIFIDTRDQCKAKSDEWDERCRLRTDQMVGINKALEILTADSARGTFQGSATRTVEIFGGAGVKGLSFVQTNAQHSSASEQAYLALKKVIHEEPTKNLRLARLASTVRTATKGHFDAVIESVDGMLTTLHDEQEADTEQKYWCISEIDKNERDKSDFEYAISQLDAKIKRAEVKKSELEDDKAKTLENNATLAQMVIDARADREAQSAEYTTAKADDIAAISLLADAMAALSEYGENNAFVQQKTKQPVFDISEDAAPQEQFSSADEHAGAQTGVIKLMAAIKEDLEHEVSLATKAEAKAALNFAKLVITSNEQHEAYNAEVVGLDDAIAATDLTISKHKDTRTDTEAELQATVDYLLRIKPNCDWILGAFDSRQSARRAEAKGLNEAKSVLAGAAPTNVGFLQKVQ